MLLITNTGYATQNIQKIKVLVPHFPKENVDPIKLATIGDWIILQNIHSTLVELNTRLTVKPALAESWTQSADAKNWVFNLKKNLKWSDGSEMSAEHICLSIKRALKSTSHTELSTYVSSIISNNKQSTIEFNLKKIAPNFLLSLALADVSIVHPLAYKEGAYTWNIPLSGPYILKKFSKNSISLARNKFYWNNSEQDFDEVQFDYGFREKDEISRFVDQNYDAGQPFTALLEGEDSFSIFKKNYNIFSSNLDMNVTLNFSQKRSRSKLLSVEVRRYLFERIYASFWKNEFNNPSRSVGLRPPGMLGALTFSDFDGEYSKLKKNKAKFDRQLDILVTHEIANLEFFRKLLSILDGEGIKYKINKKDPLQIRTLQGQGDFDILPMFLGASEYDPDTAWRIFNDVNFAKPPATKAELNRALMEKDIKKREDMYKEFERRAIREALFIPLKNEPTYIITSKKLKLDKKLAADWGLQIYKLRLK